MNHIQSISNEIYSIPLSADQYIIYAPLKRIAFICNQSLVNNIFDIANGKINNNPDLQKLIKQFNLLEADNLPIDDYIINGTLYDSVILFLTNQCQLKCVYCYASAGDFEKEAMGWDTAKTAIDYVYSSVKKSGIKTFTLGFHGGGEPSLNWQVLVDSVNYVKKITRDDEIDIKITGAFNGIWNDNQISFIKNNFTDISLSFDGISKIQDFQRPKKNGEGSYNKLLKSLKIIDKSNLKYGIRMTITEYSVNFLPESVEYICSNFNPQTIQVEPVFLQGRAIKNDCIIKTDTFFIGQFIEAFKIAEKRGINLFYSGARLQTLTQRFCLAPCKALIVTPNGNLTTCFEIYSEKHPLSSKFIYGHINNDKIFTDNSNSSKFLSRTVGKIPFCEDCFCKWHCAGDCAAKTGFEDSIFREKSDRCFINRELIKFLLINNIHNNGGIYWHNNNNSGNHEQ